jgi:hypothetical protein
MKNLHKFYNRADIPWVNLIWKAYYSNRGTPQTIKPKTSFWWRDCLSLQDKYKELTSVEIQNGKTVALWKDNWDNSIRQDEYPHLHSFAKNQNIIFDKAMEISNENIYDMFQLPLSTIAHEELHNLEHEILNMEITGDHDIWSFNWGNSFSTKKVYRELMGNHEVPNSITAIWKSCSIPRHKIFFWLLLNGRLNTKDMMKHKNFYVEFSDCILCEACPEETIMHLFFECTFSQSFWWALGLEWNVDMTLYQMIEEAQQRFSLGFLMEVMIAGCWSIWDQRNDAIFNANYPNVQTCMTRFKATFTLTMHRAKPSLREGMQSWLDTL